MKRPLPHALRRISTALIILPFQLILTATGSAQSLETSLDTAGLTWLSGGDANWFGQTSESKDGVDAARSGAIEDGSETWVETSVTGPGVLNFWWKVSSESGFDYLDVYLDGLRQSGRISGEVDWTQRSLTIDEGVHQIRWTYSKDSSDEAGADAAWLDGVSYLPDGPVNTLAASNLTEVSATLNGKINPNGLPTSAVFEYGTSTAYGSSVAVSLSPNNGSSVQNVSAMLSGLLPGTVYHFRLRATNDSNPPPGTDLTFTTLSPFVYEKNVQEITIVRYTGSIKDVVIPATIEGLPVTRIDSYAFESRSDITSVNIPNSITSIGEYAFEGCDGLKSVILPSALETMEEGAFYDCENLSSVTFPSGVMTLGSWVFSNCGNLTQVSLPNSITRIGSSAFSDCSKLSTVTLPSGLSAIEAGTFNNCGKLSNIEIPSTVSEIGSNAFSRCSSLANLALPSGLTSLGASAFSDCVSLTNMSLPNGLTRLENGTFEACTKLASVSLPSTLTSLGSNAFSNCTRLSNLTLPNGIQTIEFGTFRNCSSLVSMVIPSSVNRIEDYAFAKCLKLATLELSSNITHLGYSAFEGCSALTALELPAALTSLGGYAFANCVKLSGAILPSGLTALPDGVFQACHSLTSIVIPSSITSIGSQAFSNCRRLTSILIPNSVLTLGSYAFENCIELVSATLSENLTRLEDGIFSGCVKLNAITIPSGVTQIGQQAFLKCYQLTNIVIPGTVTTIGYEAFADCRNLSSVTIPANVTEIGGSAFSGCRNLTVLTVDPINSSYSSISGVLFDKSQSRLIKCPDSKTGALVIPSSVTRIEDEAFLDCRKLTSVSIPNGVVSIGDNAFQSCYGLTELTIPNSVIEIGYSSFENCIQLQAVTLSNQLTEIPELAFAGCGQLTTLTLPESVTSIGFQAFFDCSKLATLNLPSRLSYIESYAFAFCGSLTQVSIPQDVSSLGFGAFSACGKLASISVHSLNSDYSDIDGVLFDKEQTTLIKVPEAKIGAYTIPSGVTRIANSALQYCGGLTNVTLPESLSIIGDSAFRHCRNLTRIAIPEGVEEIGNYAFAGCSALSRVVLPSSLEEIGFEAFAGCMSLKTISIPEEVDEIGSRAFAGSGMSQLYFEGDAPSMGDEVFYPLVSSAFTVHYLNDSRGYTGSSWLGHSAIGMSAFSPEISVEEPVNTSLQDGTSTVSFGSILVASQVSKTFVIRNLGTRELAGLAASVSGTHSADYTVAGLNEDSLMPGESTTFTISFSPTAVGTRIASLQIANNDADESPFDVNLTGLGTQPEISVFEAKELTNKKSTISFGSATVGKTTVIKKFTIKNVGTATLSGLAVTKNGTHAAEYTVSKLSKTSLGAGSSGTFTVTFKPVAKGTRTATIYIASNDADENPFTIKLTASALTATKVKKSTIELATNESEATKILNPTLRSPRYGVLVIEGEKYRTITYPDSLVGEDATRLAEVSPNLVDWSSGNKHTTVVSRKNGLIKMRDNRPTTPENKRFIRLRRVMK